MLRVWLPLTKDLRQQGLSSATVINNGATFDSAGKLGGCYTFGSGKYMRATPASSLMQAKAVSVACWVKITSWNSSYDCLMSWADGTSWTNSRVTLARNNTSSKLCFTIANGTNYTTVNCTTNLALNTWYHIVGTYDGSNIKIYINGNLEGTATSTLSIVYAGAFNIGGWSGNNYPINGSLSDIRLYNHCLSPMEVKELAKGLVLHYPLNRGGFGNENIIAGTKPTEQTYTYPSSGFQDKFAPITTVIPSENKYTLSFYAKSTVAGDKIRAHYYSPNTTTTCISSQGITKTASDGNMDFTLSTEWELYWVTYTQTETTAVKHIILPRMGAVGNTNGIVSGTGTVSIKCLKLEAGDKVTPWCPNSSDALATTMGLNSTTEYDCSGFCNNGTRTGTFSWTSDTPKYAVSTKFNGTEVIVVPFTCGSIPDAVTIACWGYESNWNVSTAERLLGAATNSSGWCIGDYGSENTLFAFYANGGYNVATGFKQLSAGWHHFVITFDGLNLIYYVDGQQFSKKTFSTKQVVVGNYNINIGRHYGGGYNFKGNMSDVRIYATALSASDVKSLYQNSAYIDSSGNIYGAVHTEV